MKQRLIQFCLLALALGQLCAQPGPGAAAPPPHPPGGRKAIRPGHSAGGIRIRSGR